MYQMFSVHATPGEVKNVTITVLLDIMIIAMPSFFEKLRWRISMGGRPNRRKKPRSVDDSQELR